MKENPPLPGVEPFGNLRILVVEDDPDMRASMHDALVMQGFSVNTATSGSDALRQASTGDFDVVVSDIRLPGLNGIELTRRLLEMTPRPKIILITAYPDPETVKEAYVAGATHFIPKPMSLRTLSRVVEETAFDARLGL